MCVRERIHKAARVVECRGAAKERARRVRGRRRRRRVKRASGGGGGSVEDRRPAGLHTRARRRRGWLARPCYYSSSREPRENRLPTTHLLHFLLFSFPSQSAIAARRSLHARAIYIYISRLRERAKLTTYSTHARTQREY